MATPEAQDAAAKQRIIKHMNADHSDSIRRYLEAFTRTTLFQSHGAQMADITLTEMKLRNGSTYSTIPFDPPMKSLREARERLMQLDKDSLKILGRSDISITKYVPPYAKLGHLYNFTQCMLAYLLLPRPANFRPGSLLYETVLFRMPLFARFVEQICVIVFVIMIPIHLFEAGLMARKLAKHGLTPKDAVWWPWVGSTFVEGFTAFWRLNDLIEQRKKEKESKRH